MTKQWIGLSRGAMGALAVLLAHCGPGTMAGDDGSTDAAPTSDASPDATSGDEGMADAGGGDAGDAGDAAEGGAAACTLTRVIASTSDGTAGGYLAGTIAPPSVRALMAPAGATVAQDHAVRTSGCVAFDLFRTFAAEPNQVVVLDPANPFVPRRTIALPTVPTGAAGAPQSAMPCTPAVAVSVSTSVSVAVSITATVLRAGARRRSTVKSWRPGPFSKGRRAEGR